MQDIAEASFKKVNTMIYDLKKSRIIKMFEISLFTVEANKNVFWLVCFESLSPVAHTCYSELNQLAKSTG
ncbi:MAG: hypothetical protein DCF25_04775 [Leptolyngbya foveolarum]|uniref:Uncharacterized protein n=1 Tax=Leptolyngbya foveolarum TaxID=47253 RepID=A0A2W4UR12_9CYAN|nr:MAG: hypothetical protein DCF25_04775 [Leptolyngbya foveolarum]